MNITLRKYQQDIINQLRELLKSHRAIIVCLATGGGKSIIEAHIVKHAKNHNNRSYITTHRNEIFHQLVRHCIKQDVYPGQILSGQRMTSNLVQVAMIQTLYRKMKYLEKCWPQLILADEAHHLPAKTFNNVINFKSETKIIGFTATPQRTDGTGLNTSGFTAMIEGAQTYDLVKAGYLTNPVVLSSETTKLFREQKFKKSGKDYNKDDQFCFTSRKAIVNDTINMYNKYFAGAPCIIFCCSVSDCELVASAMRGAGWKCEAVHEKVNIDLRREYIDGLGTGKMNAITSYDIVGEGVDISILAGIIIRRLTCSLINWLQWCGRALRKAPGKDKAIIIDQAGNIFDHGHPLLIREWKLTGSTKLKDENDIQIKQCQYCGCWVSKNTKICPGCGSSLINTPEQKPSKIKIINEPLKEIKPPDIPVGRFALDVAEISEFNEIDLDFEIIEKIKLLKDNNFEDIKDRFYYICRAFNKNNKWIKKTWDMINV